MHEINAKFIPKFSLFFSFLSFSPFLLFSPFSLVLAFSAAFYLVLITGVEIVETVTTFLALLSLD